MVGLASSLCVRSLSRAIAHEQGMTTPWTRPPSKFRAGAGTGRQFQGRTAAAEIVAVVPRPAASGACFFHARVWGRRVPRSSRQLIKKRPLACARSTRTAAPCSAGNADHHGPPQTHTKTHRRRRQQQQAAAGGGRSSKQGRQAGGGGGGGGIPSSPTLSSHSRRGHVHLGRQQSATSKQPCRRRRGGG